MSLTSVDIRLWFNGIQILQMLDGGEGSVIWFGRTTIYQKTGIVWSH